MREDNLAKQIAKMRKHELLNFQTQKESALCGRK